MTSRLSAVQIAWVPKGHDLDLAEPPNEETRSVSGFREHRYGDSNPGFRTENPAS